MYYVDCWFPQIAEGENVRVSRYISIPDIEAQLAPNNLTYPVKAPGALTRIGGAVS